MQYVAFMFFLLFPLLSQSGDHLRVFLYNANDVRFKPLSGAIGIRLDNARSRSVQQLQTSIAGRYYDFDDVSLFHSEGGRESGRHVLQDERKNITVETAVDRNFSLAAVKIDDIDAPERQDLFSGVFLGSAQTNQFVRFKVSGAGMVYVKIPVMVGCHIPEEYKGNVSITMQAYVFYQSDTGRQMGSRKIFIKDKDCSSMHTVYLENDIGVNNEDFTAVFGLTAFIQNR